MQFRNVTRLWESHCSLKYFGALLVYPICTVCSPGSEEFPHNWAFLGRKVLSWIIASETLPMFPLHPLTIPPCSWNRPDVGLSYYSVFTTSSAKMFHYQIIVLNYNWISRIIPRNTSEWQQKPLVWRKISHGGPCDSLLWFWALRVSCERPRRPHLTRMQPPLKIVCQKFFWGSRAHSKNTLMDHDQRLSNPNNKEILNKITFNLVSWRFVNYPD